jgi:hypothetical protein
MTVESAQWSTPEPDPDDVTAPFRLIAAVIDGQEMSVPDDPVNIQRQQIAAWEEEGNEIAAYVPPEPPPPPVPDEISRSQFYQEASVEGMITQQEAMGAVTQGAIPASINDYILTLPSADQFGAQMYFAGRALFNRTNTYIVGYFASLDKDTDDINAFWTAASLLGGGA